MKSFDTNGIYQFNFLILYYIIFICLIIYIAYQEPLQKDVENLLKKSVFSG